MQFSPKKQAFGLHIEKLPQNQSSKNGREDSPHMNNLIELREPSDGGDELSKRGNPDAQRTDPKTGQMLLLKVPEGQDIKEKERGPEKPGTAQPDGKNAQLGHPVGRRQQALDVYENDEMIDCFMDDIDEMSMCEGSRQSQQDFNYNARGTMSQKKNAILDTNNWPRAPSPARGQTFPYQGGGRPNTRPYASSALELRGQLAVSTQQQDSTQMLQGKENAGLHQADRQAWGVPPAASILSADGINLPSHRSGHAAQGGWMSGDFPAGSESMLWTLDGKLPSGTPRMQNGGELGLYPGMNETPTRFSNIAPGAHNNLMYMDPTYFHDNISLAYLNQSQSVLDVNVDHRASRVEAHPSRGPISFPEPPTKASLVAPKDDGMLAKPPRAGEGGQLLINQALGPGNPEQKIRNGSTKPALKVTTSHKPESNFNQAAKTEQASNSPTPRRSPERSAGPSNKNLQRSGLTKKEGAAG